jgi:hypothetical protein
MNKIYIYYLICVAYCIIVQFVSSKNKSYDDIIGLTPAFDALIAVLLGWILAPIDLFLRIRTNIKNKLKKA